MSYCNGKCEHLNEKKHKCELTGEKLTFMKYSCGISYTVHEHSGFCDNDLSTDQYREYLDMKKDIQSISR